MSNETRRMTTAQAVIRFLAAQFSERDGKRRRLIAGTWGIFGHGNVAGLGQALYEVGPEVGMPFYRPQNEQGQVHAAVAFARHQHRLSTMACTASIGPGSSNMLTGAALATINRIPVLLLPSDYFANRVPDPVLQQLEHPTQHDVSVNDAFRPLSRFYTRIERPEQLLSALPEAMRVLTDPAETGAVVVALPEDVQAEAFDFPAAFFAERVWRVRRPEPEQELVERAADWIMSAERPLVVAGGGVRYSEASRALAEFAARFGVPVVESQAGRGSLPWDAAEALGAVGSAGGAAANALAAEADLVLAVGTRLGDFVTGSRSAFQYPAVRMIGLNVSPFDAGKLQALPLVADALRGLEALSSELEARGWRGTGAAYRQRYGDLRRSWNDTVTKLRSQADDGDVADADLAQAHVIGLVNEAFGGDAVMICAAGSMPGDLLKLWRPQSPDSYHVEYGYSCMGYEIPAGIGVRLAEPGRPVVVMIGDGSYLMMNSEIVTAVAEEMDLVVVVVDNHGFQSIHGLQRATGTPEFGLELRRRGASGQLDGPYVRVDYAAHAAAMGANATFVDTSADLVDALAAARDAGGVQVVVVRVDPEKRVGDYGSWWDVPVAEASELTSVDEARERYLAGKATQRRYRRASRRWPKASKRYWRTRRSTRSSSPRPPRCTPRRSARPPRRAKPSSVRSRWRST